MKILLISDIPPCENLTAGLVLSALIRFLPKDSICIYIVYNPAVDIELSSEFANIPVQLDTKPNENWSFLPQRRFFKIISNLISYVAEITISKFSVEPKCKKVIQFGREQKVDRVWAVLQGQTTIRMAKNVAEGLGVPLHTHVWDPFSWWAKAHCLDKKTHLKVQQDFNKAISASVSVATASEPMAEIYNQHFGVKAIPLIASHSESLSKQPSIKLKQKGTILIGMAGQFYAIAEWRSLLKALDSADWKIENRKVRVIVLGPQAPPGFYSDENVKYLGWKNQNDAASILSLCDILYCPYPFDDDMKEVSSLSFPSKIVLYLAAGRPIVFHGPNYSSPARYINERKCGLIAEKVFPSAIYNEMNRLIIDNELYKELSINSQKAFLSDFTLNSMRESFSNFIGSKEFLLIQEYEQHSLCKEDPKLLEMASCIDNVKIKSIRILYNKRKLIRTWVKEKIIKRIAIFKRYHKEIDRYKKENEKLKKIISKFNLNEGKILVISDDLNGCNSPGEIIHSSTLIDNDGSCIQDIDGCLFNIFTCMNNKVVLINTKHIKLIECIVKIASLLSLKVIFSVMELDKINEVMKALELDGIEYNKESNLCLTEK